MIKNIFPSYFYSVVPLSNKEKVFKKFKYVKTDKEGTKKISWNRYCAVNVEQFYPQDVASIILEPLGKFFKEWRIDPKIELLDIWRNTYQEGGFQEIHDHMTSQLSDLSGCIFFEDHDELASQFYFFNSHSAEMGPTWRSIMADRDIQPYNYFIKPKAGDVLLFPSYMLHGVTVHKLKKPRTTVSFNVKFLK